MEWRKVKTIFIYVLIVVTLFLVGVLAAEYKRDNYLGTDVTQRAQELLQKRGFVFQKPISGKKHQVTVYRQKYNVLDKQKISQAVLQGAPVAEMSGSDVIYKNQNDSMTFFENGQISIDLTQRPLFVNTPEGLALRLEKLFGLQRNELKVIIDENRGNNFAVRVLQYEDGIPLEGYFLKGHLRSGRVTDLEGIILPAGERTAASRYSMDEVAALFRFADYNGREERPVILSMQCVYNVKQGNWGGAELVPAIKITTALTSYYVYYGGEVEQA